MPRFTRHVFVCTNLRDADNPKGSCALKGGPAVQARFKELVHLRGLKAQVRANSAGCLDACEHGVSVVVYPEQIWYGAVTPADVDEIVEKHLVGGEPVERLRIKDYPR